MARLGVRHTSPTRSSIHQSGTISGVVPSTSAMIFSPSVSWPSSDGASTSRRWSVRCVRRSSVNHHHARSDAPTIRECIETLVDRRTARDRRRSARSEIQVHLHSQASWRNLVEGFFFKLTLFGPAPHPRLRAQGAPHGAVDYFNDDPVAHACALRAAGCTARC